mmetsp:Transcript_13525/g.49212  ORF Transcript_13525/g.49212 Transcript_13525/m.49212 type:complete len:454 (+) Transcript_13525:276-1637(+)
MNRYGRHSRGDSVMDTLYQYRSVILLVSIPVLLILSVIALWPSTNADNPFGDSEASKEMYGVVFDAGSTGSRVHVYRFEVGGGRVELKDELFEALKPGLSSFAGEPRQGAMSLQPLLEKAIARVPVELRSKTKLSLRATAGLRMLPAEQADGLLEAVKEFLEQQSPFAMDEESVSIMDGVDEGAFGWVTVNYLLGKLGQPYDKTVGVVDLGGGSVQFMYAVSPTVAKKAPAGYVRQLRGGGKTYDVYVHSYLGYGLMAGRAATLDAVGERGHPCIPPSYESGFTYGGKERLVIGTAESQASFEECASVIKRAMRVGVPCEAPSGCSFNGQWGGGGGAGSDEVYAMSYLYERADQAHAGSFLPDEGLGRITPAELAQAAEKVCRTPLSEVASTYPEAPDPPFLCMDVTYSYVLLSQGLQFPVHREYKMVKKIEYNGESVEAAWSLGNAIGDLST